MTAPTLTKGVTSAETARAMLYSSFLTVLTTMRRHWRLCRLFLVEAAGIDKGFQDQLDEHYRAWHELVVGTLRAFEAKGLTRPGLDVDVAAEMVVGMVDRVTRRFDCDVQASAGSSAAALPLEPISPGELEAAVADGELQGTAEACPHGVFASRQ